MGEIETFLDVQQVAQYLKLSVATIRKWVLNRRIPYKKIGRAVRFSSLEIEEWLISKCSIPFQPKKESVGGDK
jgi:excisionase family DNA binding protein